MKRYVKNKIRREITNGALSEKRGQVAPEQMPGGASSDGKMSLPVMVPERRCGWVQTGAGLEHGQLSVSVAT